ncbi:hypothetical protein M1D49_09010 [Bacillus sp. PK3-056]|uniref:hypothetical protein n=1 Tax=Niallia circulans TaxID=1397 RepID=UPI000F450A9B|nr:hypothetical protein [Niallia circulans]AYV74483.1 hypothetical protein C2H98_24570 [Niallia circulans]
MFDLDKPEIVYQIPISIFITVIVTIVTAIVAQFLSHFLTARRDKKKEFMQKYQDLYSSILAPLSNYMSIRTNPRRLHDVHHNVVVSDLLDITINRYKENLKYSSPVLLKVYERYYGYGYYEDGWGSKEEADKHALVYFLLDDLLRSSKWTGIFSRADRARLKYLKYYYGICSMALTFFDMSDTELILGMENFSGVWKKIRYQDYGNALLVLDRKKFKKGILRHLNYVKKSEKDVYKNIYEDLKKRK